MLIKKRMISVNDIDLAETTPKTNGLKESDFDFGENKNCQNCEDLKI